MGKRRSHHMRLGLFLGVGLAATAIAFTAYAGGILRSQEQSTVDVRFSIRGSHGTPKDIVLVGIDATPSATSASAGRFRADGMRAWSTGCTGRARG